MIHLPRRTLRSAFIGAAVVALALVPALSAQQFDVSFPAAAHSGPITGRVFVFLSRDSTPDPRFQAGGYGASVPFFGVDVDALEPGRGAVVDAGTLGFPVASLKLPVESPAISFLLRPMSNSLECTFMGGTPKTTFTPTS